MWTDSFYLGGIYSLLCILTGAFLTLIAVAVWPYHEPPDDDGESVPIDPSPAELEAWLERNTVFEFPEANLMEGRVLTGSDVDGLRWSDPNDTTWDRR